MSIPRTCNRLRAGTTGEYAGRRRRPPCAAHRGGYDWGGERGSREEADMAARLRLARLILARLVGAVAGIGTFLWFVALSPVVVLVVPAGGAPFAAALVALAGLEAGRRMTSAATAAAASLLCVSLERSPVTRRHLAAVVLSSAVAGMAAASAILDALAPRSLAG